VSGVISGSFRRHKTLKKYLFFAGFLLILGGCREFSGADYLPYGHPADPASRDGKKARMSRSLIPEDKDVRPDLAIATPPKSMSPGQMSSGGGNSAHRGSH
jgi:hypothetical protein